jgi:hypothetical protein
VSGTRSGARAGAIRLRSRPHRVQRDEADNEWNGIEHKRGLVIVHNIILLKNVGPNTGPITLQNVRFPFKVPTFAPLVTVLPAASANAQPFAAD